MPEAPTETQTQAVLPAWAQADAFPVKPDDAPFGYLNTKGHPHPAETAEELADLIAKARDGIDLVWHPDSDRLVTPEELPALHKPLRQRQKRHAARDITDGLRMSAVFAIALTWSGWAAWNNGGQNFKALYTHQLTGLAAMLFVIFGLIPLYEGWKLRRKLSNTKKSDLANEIPEARFDAWLYLQKTPITRVLMGIVIVIGIAQLAIDWSQAGQPSIERAGHLKTPGLPWWRGLTGAMLHGNVIHLLLNLSGLLYLGRRTETLARWPHLTIVFLLSIWAGASATSHWNPTTPAVGISGGLMGLLGFLMVFESLHQKVVPRPARRRLLAGLILMLVIGQLGMSFIDNAAHIGGLLLGIIYAAVIFPPSSSPQRPKMLGRDQLIGYASLAAIAIISAACLLLLVKT